MKIKLKLNVPIMAFSFAILAACSSEEGMKQKEISQQERQETRSIEKAHSKEVALEYQEKIIRENEDLQKRKLDSKLASESSSKEDELKKEDAQKYEAEVLSRGGSASVAEALGMLHSNGYR